MRYITIPFEDQTYSKYLEGLVMCDISLNGYSMGLLDALNGLGDMVYPLINNGRQQYGGYGNNTYGTRNNNYGSNN